MNETPPFIQETFNAEPDFAYGFYRDLWLGPLVAEAEAAGVVAPA